MSNDRDQQIKEHAYRLWQEAGRPADRALDHWVEAERRVKAGGSTPGQANEGEGNVTAARNYNRKARKFAETGPVEAQAKQAAADLDGPKKRSLQKAEAAGRSRSRGEDPAVKASKPR